MEKNTFDIVIVNGRPAAGKSEVIDFLKNVPLKERVEKFHIGEFEEIDDFPILWERFEDDDLMEEMGLPRLISDKEFEYNGEKLPGYTFKEQWFWNFLIKKLNLAYEKKLRDNPDYHKDKTLLIEFSRGSQHGGFREAYNYLSDEVLSKAVTLYISVTWEESLRKNRRRYNPDRPDSWLEHALEDKKLEMMYKESDWEDFSAADPDFLLVKGYKVPYAVFDNMPEKTDDPEKIRPHLEAVMARLWENRKRSRNNV
ncbi:MAG: hypothetical protein GXO69_11130 [Acidobacteria bacterium]|nr:hypothetical protein [Acidobacteriota bacterium]